MRRILRAGLHVAGSSLAGLLCATSAVASTPIPLAAGWRIESSAKTTSGGETISRPGFDARAWHPATVPATVVAALVANGDYPDPYFGMQLTASGAKGDHTSRNFYSLSAKPDVLSDKSEWYFTPTVSHGELTALASLPPAQLTATATMTRRGSEPSGRVTLANTGRALAFQVRLKAVDATGTEILPVYWQDNYVTLLPGARREIAVSWPSSAKAAALVAIEGWNVASMRVTPRAVR
jgi:hypothetical protein